MTEYKALVVKGNFISTCEYDYMVFAQFDWFAKFMRLECALYNSTFVEYITTNINMRLDKKGCNVFCCSRNVQRISPLSVNHFIRKPIDNEDLLKV